MLRTMLKNVVWEGIRKISPKWHYQILMQRLEKRITISHPEFKILLSLCDENKMAIDIGSSAGNLTMLLLKYSQACYAFEPNHMTVEILNRNFKGSDKPVFIEEVALSDNNGSVEMRYFPRFPGQSTIEPSNIRDDRGKEVTFIVKKKRLDDYKLSNISCIKIDAEGHEEAIIRGAIETLEKEKPC